MSMLCGGEAGVLKDIYWSVVYMFQRDKEVCPRCKCSSFRHGFHPDDRVYCTFCHLWEPDWKKVFDEVKNRDGRVSI